MTWLRLGFVLEQIAISRPSKPFSGGAMFSMLLQRVLPAEPSFTRRTLKRP